MLGEIGGRSRKGRPRIRWLDGWMASWTRWTWVWVNSGRWWWTGRPGVLRFMGSQRIRHDWATELSDWTDRSFALSHSVYSTLKRQSWETDKMGEAEWVQPMSSQVESVALITLLPWEQFLTSSVFCFLPWKCIYYHPSYKANTRLKWEKTCEVLEVSGK